MIPHHAISSSSKLERKATWSRFHSAEKIVSATREAIRSLPANVFQQCFQQLWRGYLEVTVQEKLRSGWPGPFVKVFTPVLADLHSGQRRLF
jgi:hypothetical protein